MSNKTTSGETLVGLVFKWRRSDGTTVGDELCLPCAAASISSSTSPYLEDAERLTVEPILGTPKYAREHGQRERRRDGLLIDRLRCAQCGRVVHEEEVD